MKKLTTILALAAFAFALTSAPASACGGSKACVKGKTSASNTSASYTCGKGSSATTASATNSACPAISKNCPLANGAFAVASYNVEGLTCGGCELNLTNAFEAADGVVMIPNVSFADGSAKVIYDPTLTNVEALTKVISDAGYKGEIIPAVAISNTSSASSKGYPGCSASNGATANTSGSKAVCSKSKSSATTASASGKVCPHALNGAKATTVAATASGAACSASCSQLTSAERQAFCAKFCQAGKKSAKKSTDI